MDGKPEVAIDGTEPCEDVLLLPRSVVGPQGQVFVFCHEVAGLPRVDSLVGLFEQVYALKQ